MAAFQPRTSGRSLFSSQALFDFSHLDDRVQSHLKNVYSCLSIGMLSAALGAYAHLMFGLGEWYLLTVIASFGLIIWLGTTRHSKEDVTKRVGIFSAFTFTSGVSLGPLIEVVIRIDPSIVSTALAGTAVIFICFSLSALLWKDRTFLYMGGMLFSCLSWLTLAGLLNIFFRSPLVFNVYIYGILLLFSAFVLYDTQLIVEKRKRGDEDFIWHSVDLFLDAVQIFRALLVILAKKSGKKKNSK
ncbi:probable Bax inhibitor 1 isoform X2 [Physella acuta]|uniref:probable Bax inhibitor 1 isoform X2 n=1 Tax=Physella acuta TaxID=109671 RepID=UPI0027DCCCCC|nr:probable Bax inhibitor 1 isoform X2 [Physella acuta]